MSAISAGTCANRVLGSLEPHLAMRQASGRGIGATFCEHPDSLWERTVGPGDDMEWGIHRQCSGSFHIVRRHGGRRAGSKADFSMVKRLICFAIIFVFGGAAIYCPTARGAIVVLRAW